MCNVGIGRNDLRSRVSLLILLLGVTSYVLAAGPGRGPLRANPILNGPYTIEFRGILKGTGRATVSAANVNVGPVQLRAADGSLVTFHAPNLRRDGYRFSGTGTARGRSVRIIGRLDPPTDASPKSRLICTFETADNEYGRALGWKQ
jgi:hypothetical protein